MRVESFTDDDTDTAWLRPGRLPDAPVILEGRGGLGKSSLTTYLAARISRGRMWPDGAKGSKPGGVLLMGAEDRKGIVRGRLVAAGANMDRVYRIDAANIATEYDQFERLIQARRVRLVVLDPVSDLLGVPMRDEDQVRRILGKLDQTCERYKCGMILIRHMRKDANDEDPMEDGGRGTGALRNFVRAVYRVLVDPDDDDKRLFMPTKFNYGPAPDTLVFQFAEGQLLWSADPSRWNAHNLIGRQRDAVRRTQAQECMEWMKDYFRESGYRAKAAVVLAAGRKEGFHASTIQRARVSLNVISAKLPEFQGEYLWTHPLYDPDEFDRDPSMWAPNDVRYR